MLFWFLTCEHFKLKNTARLYNCIRCHAQVMICSHCDRGNRYCTACAPIASLEAKRRAGERYQNSPKGRRSHAERQKRYLAKRNKVTHRGSSVISLHDLIRPLEKNTAKTASIGVNPSDNEICCHYCDKLCSIFIRRHHFHSTA